MSANASLLQALNLGQHAITRLTNDAPGTDYPAWSADGRRVVYRRLSVPFLVGG